MPVPAEDMATCRLRRSDTTHVLMERCRRHRVVALWSICGNAQEASQPSFYIPSADLNCHIMLFIESPLPSLLHLPTYGSFFLQPPLCSSSSASPSATSHFHLSFFLLPCDCSHFLTLPRTSHTQPFGDPQTDPR